MASPGTRTDLGEIYVISRGNKDQIFLTHNHVLALEVTCTPDEAGRYKLGKKFKGYSQTQWRTVWDAYTIWKRRNTLGLKLPRFSGLTKDTKGHPWRRKQPANAPPKGTP